MSQPNQAHSNEDRATTFLEYVRANGFDLRPGEKKGYLLSKGGEHPVTVDSERFERMVRYWLLKESIPQTNELVSNLLPVIEMLVHPKLLP
jgi:hypothetical protein